MEPRPLEPHNTSSLTKTMQALSVYLGTFWHSGFLKLASDILDIMIRKCSFNLFLLACFCLFFFIGIHRFKGVAWLPATAKSKSLFVTPFQRLGMACDIKTKAVFLQNGVIKDWLCVISVIISLSLNLWRVKTTLTGLQGRSITCLNCVKLGDSGKQSL